MSLRETLSDVRAAGYDRRHWARRTGDVRLRAYTDDMAARAYAADGQRDACVNALDTAHSVLTTADYNAPSFSVYDEGFHRATRGTCHLMLGEPDHAISYARQSLTLLDRLSARFLALTMIDLGEAYVQCTEIDEAARLLGDAGELAAGHSSARLIERLEQARGRLEPWKDTRAVRELDERVGDTVNN